MPLPKGQNPNRPQKVGFKYMIRSPNMAVIMAYSAVFCPKIHANHIISCIQDAVHLPALLSGNRVCSCFPMLSKHE